jgi:hypothetical protein
VNVYLSKEGSQEAGRDNIGIGMALTLTLTYLVRTRTKSPLVVTPSIIDVCGESGGGIMPRGMLGE